MEPVKWLKYLLLVEFRLRQLPELCAEIERVSWSARWELFERLRARLPEEAPTEFTVVKLVTARGIGQLENVRLATQRNLGKLRSRLAERRSDIVEVWACRTRIGQNVLSVAGRLAIETRLEPFGHCVEQVWQCSPRLLESRGPNFKFPYARATRAGWGRSYHLDELWLPKGWRRRRAAVQVDFAESMRALERGRSRLEELAEFIESAGITSYSFEYKIVGGHLSIIDWDTNSDWEVLRNAGRVGLLPVLQ